MKVKSTKQRMLVTMHTLFKLSDRDHRINITKLNQQMQELDLECTSGALIDTVEAMREFGLDVRSKGAWDRRGVWLESRPISEDMLRRLVFAISTNPYLPQTQIRECLDSLRPVMTVYQEAELLNVPEVHNEATVDEAFADRYFKVFEAIRQKQQLCYTTNGIRFDRKSGEIHLRERRKTRFTPKCLYRDENRICMVGYNHTDKCVNAVDLSDIVSLCPPTHQMNTAIDDTEGALLDVDLGKYVPRSCSPVIYRGPAVFMCRGRHLKELVDRFGMPDEPVKKNHSGHATFILHKAEIRPDTLVWLSQIPVHGIRVKGPKDLVEAVRSHCAKEINTLFSLRLDKE